MPRILSDALPRRGAMAVAALTAGSLLLAGCGGSSHTSGNTTPTGASLAAGLAKTMATTQPNLKNLKVHCPGGAVTHYPVKCDFTATSLIGVKGKHLRLPAGGTIIVNSVQGSKINYALNFHNPS